MTKISQLTDIGGGLAPNDEFIIRDVSDPSTPNKKVTASGFFVVASALGISGFDNITAGLPATGTQLRVYASGISGRSDTTISGITVARTTISGYYENASGTASGILYPIVTQADIGSAPNQVPLNGFLGTMAYQDANFVSVGLITVSGVSGPIPVSSGTAAAPAISPIGDSNTGIFFPSGDTIAFAEGGVEALRLTPTGQLRLATAGITFNGDTATANELDDYEEGTWTPTISFFTPGDLSVVYSARIGSYTKIGDTVIVHFRLATSTFTHTTASGSMLISGLPFAPSASNPNSQGSAFSGFQGITSAAFTQYGVIVNNGQTYLSGVKNGSGQPSLNIAAGDMPTGGTVIIHGTITYKA